MGSYSVTCPNRQRRHSRPYPSKASVAGVCISHVIYGSLSAHESAPQRHLDRFSHFCRTDQWRNYVFGARMEDTCGAPTPHFDKRRLRGVEKIGRVRGQWEETGGQEWLVPIPPLCSGRKFVICESRLITSAYAPYVMWNRLFSRRKGQIL